MGAVGVIGGGQLARMMVPAAINLGIDIKVLAESEDASARLADCVVGDFRDLGQLRDFASQVDVITFDHEHVPLENLKALEDAGVRVYPPSRALRLTHNKKVMREALASINIPQPLFAVVTTPDDGVIENLGGFPVVAKLPVGGYDGKGVRVISTWDDVTDWLADGEILMEEYVPFTRELAQLSARNPSGQWSAWPAVETRQKNGVCAEVVSPAQNLGERERKAAAIIARTIAEEFDVVGVLAVELFEVGDGRILVNELAMRPHNSGHVLTEQSVTSQFEQHLRAVVDSPLGSTDHRAPVGVMVNIFGSAVFEDFAKVAHEVPDVKFHSYQKGPRAGRKAGHIVVTGEVVDVTVEKARRALQLLQGGTP